MKTHTKNPRWLQLIDQILTSPATDQRSARGNVVMMNVLEPIIKNLTAGLPLSPRQSAALIENIRRRVPGRSDFTWEGPIVLTKEQLRGLRKRALAADQTTPKSHLNPTQIPPKPHLNHTEIPPKSHPNPTETTPEEPFEPYGTGVLSPLTILNSTELNLTQIGSDHSLTARGPSKKLELIHGGGIPPEEDQREPLEAIIPQLGFASTFNGEERENGGSQSDQFNPAQGWTDKERLAARENALQGLMQLGDKAVQRETAVKPQGPLRSSVKLGQGARLDIWSDSETYCRGVLHYASAKYYLNFSGLLVAEEHLFKSRNEPGDHSFCRMVSDEIVVPLRGSDVRSDEPEYRFKASPVYKSQFYDNGIYPQMFAVLGWQGHMLKNALIVNGPDYFSVELEPNKSTNGQAPDYKGKASAGSDIAA